MKNVKNTFQPYKGFITRENHYAELIINAMMRLEGNYHIVPYLIKCVVSIDYRFTGEPLSCCNMNGYKEEYTFHF